MKRLIDKFLWHAFGILGLQPTPMADAMRAQVKADYEAAMAEYNAHVARVAARTATEPSQ